MNYYIVRIGKYSSGTGEWIYPPVEVYLNSDRQLYEIVNYYRRRYFGFDVDVKEIFFESFDIKREEKNE